MSTKLYGRRVLPGTVQAATKNPITILALSLPSFLFSCCFAALILHFFSRVFRSAHKSQSDINYTEDKMIEIGTVDINKDLTFFTEILCAAPPVEAMTPLGEGFKPGEYDVICGRGKACYNHQGNKNFRATVETYLPQYFNASSKLEKSLLVSSIVEAVREKSPEGGFVKKDHATGKWFEVGDQLAREKVGQSLRDFLHTKYRSSTQAKKERRKSQQAEATGTRSAS